MWTAYRSSKVYLSGMGFKPATVVTENGKISDILDNDVPLPSNVRLIDCDDDVIMPGIVDSHVHINEPGRTAWEGFSTATKAAAVGGITTVVDMPLNSLPPTTTVPNLIEKVSAAEGQCFIDVGFWGSVIPGNKDHLQGLYKAAVPGFKCFLIHSGVDEFPCVSKAEALEALEVLKSCPDAKLLFHAECEVDEADNDGDPANYSTFLNSRPPAMELKAIEMVIELCRVTQVACHIVHLSAAQALPLIRSAKREGLPLTVETCHHYLTLASEFIPDKATQYKCCPPIRESDNRDQLWDALAKGDIDMVVSDHSPCTPDLKLPGEKDFMDSWGGISSVQFGLSLFWTEARSRGFGLEWIPKLMCEPTAKLAGLSQTKGRIAVGQSADLVVWNPQENYQVVKDMVLHKNKLTPYMGKTLYGVVKKTILRGKVIYSHEAGVTGSPRGHLLTKGLSKL